MSSAGTGAGSTPGTELSMAGADERYADMIAEARYIVREISRGEVLSGAAFTAAQPAIQQLVAATFAADNAAPTPDQLVKLQTAKSALMALVAPVTVQSLKDTECSGTTPYRSGLFGWIRTIFMAAPGDRASVADRFSNRFVSWTIVLLLLALACTFGVDKVSQNVVDPKGAVATFAKLLLSYTYGAVGACVYLLRSLHKTIYDRSFDRRRKPEYVNRVLLGTISGGTLGLFLSSDKTTGDVVTQVGPAALGFLAGYNTDLLFTAMERVSNAILPKVDPAPAAPVPPAAPVVAAPKTNTPGEAPADPPKPPDALKPAEGANGATPPEGPPE